MNDIITDKKVLNESFNDGFPTGKYHISFSEFKNWIECSWRHKLIYILRLETQDSSPHTVFGKATHNECESYLKTRQFDFERFEKYIIDNWKDEFNKTLEDQKENLDLWVKRGIEILKEIPNFLDETFPNWEFIGAEEMLYENLEVQNLNIHLKGFIDGIIKCDGKGRNSGKKVYWIIDWKTSKNSWHPKKKRDFYTQMQLMIYKTFWSRKHNVDMKEIKTGFVILKRNANIGKKCELFEISVGPKSSDKSVNNLRKMVKSVNMNLSMKNRFNCTFCPFNKTDHCP